MKGQSVRSGFNDLARGRSLLDGSLIEMPLTYAKGMGAFYIR